MNKKELDKITKKIPGDSFAVVRDLSLLSCSVFGESQTVIIKKKFGVVFYAFWSIKNNQVDFYRSEKENARFSKVLAGRYKRNEKYANNLAKELIKLTDWFNNFVKENKKIVDFKKKAKSFFTNYKKIYALHQAVYWGGDYLSKLKIINKNQKQRTVDTLKSAYKYNELIIPKIESYFKKLKITNFLYDEIVKGIVKMSKERRSLLFLDGRRFILSPNETKKIEKIIEEKQKNANGLVKEIKGLPVTKGVYRGKVKLVIDLNNLKGVRAGDVLVTHMTRPQFNLQIKNAGAIVTNEGGILCHAALLAREFNIPCIVGTKIATKVLHDGDLVEVDADKGVVRILEKAK